MSTARTSPRRRPNQPRAVATVTAIVEAAEQVFERHGYAAGTTNRIADRAGVSIGSLYQYFPSKDALLVVLIERHLDAAAATFGDELRRALDGPAPLRPTLERLMRAAADLHADRPALHRVLFDDAPRPPAVRARLADGEARLIAGLAAYLAAAPEVAVADTEIAATLVVRSVESVVHGVLIRTADPDRADAHLDAAATMLAAYLTAGSAPTGGGR